MGSNMDKIFIVMDYVAHDLKSLMETMRHKKQVFLEGMKMNIYFQNVSYKVILFSSKYPLFLFF